MEWKKKLKRISAFALALILICNLQGISQFVVHAETSEIVEKSVGEEDSKKTIQTEEKDTTEEKTAGDETIEADRKEVISTEAIEESTEEMTEEITGEDTTEEETTEEETTEEVEVSFEESTTIDGIEIKVVADEGVFPKGATLSVHKLTDQSDTKKIKEAIREEINTEGEPVKEVKDTTSFDITILDADGNEVQPDTDKGDVRVTFEHINTAAVDKADTKVQVFHMEEDLNRAEQIISDVDTGEGTVAIKAEHFSVYVIAVTKERTETVGGTYLITTQGDSYTVNTGEKYTNATLQEIMDYIIKDNSQTVTMGGNTVNCLGDNTPTMIFGAEDGNTTVINTDALSLTGAGMSTTTVTMKGSYSGGAITCEKMTLLLPEETGTDKNTVTLSGTLTLNAGAQLNIAGGTIATAAEVGIQMSGTDAKFRMSGGTINKVFNNYAGSVIYATGSSDIQMTGGTINGGKASAFKVVNNNACGKVELLGGTITTKNSSTIIFLYNSGKDDVIIGKEDGTGPEITCIDMAAIQFLATSRKLLIQGGTIKSEYEEANAIYFVDAGSLVITGGTISSQSNATMLKEGTIYYSVPNTTVSVSGNAKVENTGTGSAIHTDKSSVRVTILGHASVTAASGPAIHCVDREKVFIGANATVISAGGTVYHSDSGSDNLYYRILINDLQQGNIRSIHFTGPVLNFTDIAEPGYYAIEGSNLFFTLSPAEGCSLTVPTVTDALRFKKQSTEDYGVINQDLTFSFTMLQQTVTISAKALLPNQLARVTGADLDSTYTASAVTHSTVKDDLFTWKGTGPLTFTYYTANTGVGVKTGSAGDTTSGAATEGGTPKNAGTYYVKASVAADGTYQAVETEYMEFYITPAKVTYIGITATGKIYDGTTDATAANINTSSITYTGVASADAPDVSLAVSNIAFDNKNAGNTTVAFSATLQLTGSAVGNYVLAPGYITGSVPTTITKKVLQVEIKDETFTGVELGDTLPTLGSNDVTITGYANNENESVLVGTLQYYIVGGTDIIGYTITIIPYGLASSNYSLNYSSKNFIVNTKYFIHTPYTITGSNNGKTGSDLWYNGAITIKPNVDAGNFKYISICTNGTDWSTWGTEAVLTTENKNGTIQIKLATGAGGTGAIVTSGDIYRSNLTGCSYQLDTTVPAYPETPADTYGIKVSNSWWRTLLHTLTFTHFWKDTQMVTVTAKEEGSGIEQAYFYKVSVSDKASYIPLTEAELEQIPTASWETSCTLEADGNYVVYAYTVDKAGNKSDYICTAGAVRDTTAPHIDSVATDNLLDVSTNLNITAQDGGSGVKEYYVYCSDTELEAVNRKAAYVKNNKTIGGTTPTIAISGLTANTTYYYDIAAEDQAGNMSDVKEGTFKTTMTQPTHIVLPTATAEYGTKVSEMPLSGGSAMESDGTTQLSGTWSFTDADQSDYPAVGTNKSYKVTFTPTDSVHYASITKTIIPNITPISPMIMVTNTTHTYTGSAIAIDAATVTGAPFIGAETPTGTVRYMYYTNATCTSKTTATDGAAGEGQAPKYVGTYYGKASIAAKGNYKAAESIVTLTIGKATPTYDANVVSNLLLERGKSLGDVTLPTGFSWESSVAVTTVQNTVGTVDATLCYNPDSVNYKSITGILVHVSVKEPLTITVNNGIATINGSTVTTALEGQSVTITANAAPVEKEFNNWTVTGATPANTAVAITSFVMGTEHVTVTANYKEKENGNNASGGSYSGNSSIEGSSTSSGTSKITSQPVTEALQQVTPAQNPATTPQKQAEIETATGAALANRKPFIKGKDGKEGWDAIAGDIEEDKEGDIINVDMNGSSVLPENILKSLQGRDITVVLDMGDGISWKVKGKDIAGGKSSDIDLAVTKGTSNIPDDVINNVSGERNHMEITLAYDGEFGFTARLSINMDKKNAGLYANLFYYNEKTGKFEFMNYGKLDENGNADLTFTHASEYTIVLDKEPMDGNVTEGGSASDDNGQKGDKSATVEVTDGLTAFGMTIYIIVSILSLVSGGIAIYAGKKKERMRRKRNKND